MRRAAQFPFNPARGDSGGNAHDQGRGVGVDGRERRAQLLGFHREHDDIGLPGRGCIIRFGANAQCPLQRLQPVRPHVGGDDLPGEDDLVGEQAADQGFRHVAGANECECFIFQAHDGFGLQK